MKNRNFDESALAAVNLSLAVHGEELSAVDFAEMTAERNDNVDSDPVNRALAVHGEELSEADVIAMTPTRRAKIDRVRATLAEGDEVGAFNRSLAAVCDESLDARDFGRMFRDSRMTMETVHAAAVSMTRAMRRRAINRSLAIHGEQV